MKKREAIKLLEKLKEQMSEHPDYFIKDVQALEIAIYTMKTTTARWWETVAGIVIVAALFGSLTLIACFVHGGF